MAVKRLDRLLSELGVASRSELRQIIRSGRVTVDGAAVTAPDAKIDADSCVLCLDGCVLCSRRLRYFVIDKPEGVLSATEDRRQNTVIDLLPPELRRLQLFPVGRLDKDTEGLLILTNDGDFAHRVISPKSGIEKLYLAGVDGEPDASDAEAFSEGLILGDGTRCMPAKLEPLGGGSCLVTVMEGKYHQVKRMLASRGKPVRHLRRLAVGALRIDDSTGPGWYRELDENDLCKVLESKTLGNR
ncbi:MAG: pseudouridine synthase [Candidatus Limivicinus sp.]|nr:pseudouridine synthase [Candidatus Limivicinus sp.]